MISDLMLLQGRLPAGNDFGNLLYGRLHLLLLLLGKALMCSLEPHLRNLNSLDLVAPSRYCIELRQIL